MEPSDKIALGCLVHLAQNYESSNQSSWLKQCLAAGGRSEKLLPHAGKLEQARKVLARCTISDGINVAIDVGRVFEMISGWGNVSHRPIYKPAKHFSQYVPSIQAVAIT
ncbi:hypothetical protein BH10CYA1_BH10CYA1_52750 [soil metagenome]